jgi:hypothetical protein
LCHGLLELLRRNVPKERQGGFACRRQLHQICVGAAKACGIFPILAPLALEAVKRIDAIFDVERKINGRSFARSARGDECAAVMYTLSQTAKLNDVDPQAWLADVLSRMTTSRTSISFPPGTGRRPAPNSRWASCTPRPSRYSYAVPPWQRCT